MTIEVKIIDMYRSMVFKNKTITEYLVYLKHGDTPVSAYVEYDSSAVVKRIETLKESYAITKVYFLKQEKK